MDRDQLTSALLLRCRFPAAPAEVTVAISGGADSTALLILAVASGLNVTAVHVDHGLRSGSDDESVAVANLSARLGATFIPKVVVVTEGPNLEARARAARLEAIGPDALTGHTADDRAATMLMNLLRGSGVAGLAAMGPDPRRPILSLRRAETEALCAAWNVAVVEDPSNKDARFTRNRVRRELLPLMSDIARRDVVPIITRCGDAMVEVDTLLEGLTVAVDPTSVKDLRSVPPLVARTAIRRWLRQDRTELHPVDAAAVARVMDVVAGRTRATQVPDRRTIRRSRGRLLIERRGGST